jgi:UDP-N-acetylmuramoyl-L-alanyl-D-glutamate--2,6-diaminopimelate ligase
MIGDRAVEARFTTPDPLQLNQLLHEMLHSGCKYVFMEVSSHAMVQKRTAGIDFTGAVFTNISHDHLDYHKSFIAYMQAKKSFFDGLGKEAFALTNIDDKNGLVMLQNTRAIKKTYGLRSLADFHAKILESGINGMQLHINNKDVWCRLIGRYNAYNLLAVYGVASLLGINKEEILTVLSQITPPEGRFDYFIGRDEITAIVDYAHTPDALENVLRTIQEIRSGNESLITVVGCGGNRDVTKRPIMASIAAANSDKVILTSDNPRMEEPEAIIEDMKAGLDVQGLRKTLIIVNRKEAIRAACAMANKSDIILVAGKGHEKYQEIKGIRTDFDDKQELLNMLMPANA